jgi:hypothetical protein
MIQGVGVQLNTQTSVVGDSFDGETRISSGALRMRISRQRRREKMRCLTIEIRDAEVDRLVALGHLRATNRDDKNEVVQSIYRFLDQSALGDAHR